LIRHLFFALVLVNLAFAAWTAWYAEPAPTAASPRETGLPIRLVGEGLPEGNGAGRVVASRRSGSTAESFEPERSGSELEGSGQESELAGSDPGRTDRGRTDRSGAEPAGTPLAGALSSAARSQAEPSATVPSGNATDTGESSAGERCVSIGPFEAVADAEAAAVTLQAAGFAPAQRSAEGELWVGFWVHLEAIPSREEANTMLAQLRDNGVPDAYLIPGEEDGDIISLGVFNTMIRAGRLDEQVRRIGLVPTILERSRPGTVHWLDISVAGGRDVDLAALGIGQARVGQRPCSAAG
jgi:hypothetical protein